MIRVMLVDDEVLALEFLKEVIEWKAHGFEIVGQALNGKKALDLFMKEKPQIIISDIKMSIMDGLELSKKIKEINPSAKIILLSAYKDFEYAKKGIQYGVSNYLLKHEINEENLLGELEKVKSEIIKEEKFREEQKRYFIKNIIYGAPREERQKYEMSFGNQLFMVMLQINKPLIQRTEKKENSAVIFKNLTDCIQKEPGTNLKYLTDVQISEDNYLILYNADFTHSEYEAEEAMREQAGKVERHLKEQSECCFTILCSKRISNCQVPGAFRELSKKIRYSPFMKQNKYYFLEQVLSEEVDGEVELLKDFENMKEELHSLQETWKTSMEKIFFAMENPNWNLNALKHFLSAWQYYYNHYKDKYHLEDKNSQEECYTVDRLKEYCMDCCFHISSQNQKEAENTYSSIVRQVMEYIEIHYSEELTLDLLGQAFHMNGAYLGQIIKKEVGKTFLKYLTDYRLAEAKKMLDSGKYNISQVADTVGYKTSQYFSQIFYKYMGMTPQEYKKWGEQGAKEKFKEKNFN